MQFEHDAIMTKVACFDSSACLSCHYTRTCTFAVFITATAPYTVALLSKYKITEQDGIE